MNEVVLDGKTYIASKIAAAEFGYAQDYVGQLCRKGLIDARRVAGHWYICRDSLVEYKSKADSFVPQPPKYQPDPNVEAKIQVDGEEYVSSALAAKLTDYNPDYIGQLAREGKVPSRNTGNRWYLQRAAILKHKEEKDAMLRAVQAESVGLRRSEANKFTETKAHAAPSSMHFSPMVYHKEDKPLFPLFAEPAQDAQLKAQPQSEPEIAMATVGRSRIPIRVMRTQNIIAKEEVDDQLYAPLQQHSISKKLSSSIPEKTMFYRLFAPYAFAAVLLGAVMLGFYNRESIYATLFPAGTTQVASANMSSRPIEASLHAFFTKELIYIRQ